MSSNGFPLQWAVSFAEIDRQLIACTSAHDVYETLANNAARYVPGAQQAGITVVLRGRYGTHGATAQVVHEVDAIQYELTGGPCVEAAGGTPFVLSPDIRTDDRFPAFGSRAAAETPVRSMLSVHVQHDLEPADALNVYSTELDAFTEESRVVAIALAAQGAIAITAARTREKAIQLETALENSRDIGIAMGVLMRANTITRDAAFLLLRGASQRTHRKLSDIAREVAETGTLDIG